MGDKYEIVYWSESGRVHFEYASNLLEALVLLDKCKKKTGAGCVSLIWREYPARTGA